MADKCGNFSYNELMTMKLESDIEEARSSLTSIMKQEDFGDEHLSEGKGTILKIKIENKCSIHQIQLQQVEKSDVESDSDVEIGLDYKIIDTFKREEYVDDVIEDTMKTSEQSVLVEDNQDLDVNLQTKGMCI